MRPAKVINGFKVVNDNNNCLRLNYNVFLICIPL